MKVLIINSVCGIRSTGRIAADIAEEYMARGDECRIAYGRERVPAEYSDIAVRIGSEAGVRANALAARIFDNEGFGAVRATARFLDRASAYDPDLLWLHNLHGYYINVGMLFDWIKSRPAMEVRWTLHDCWAFTGHCAHFSYVGCEQWRSACIRCPQKKSYPKSLFADNCKRNFEKKRAAFCGVNKMTLITPSEWLAGLVRESFLGGYPIEVVNNRIDREAFVPTASDMRRKYGIEDKIVVLGVASAWSERKGLGDFVRLAGMLGDGYAVVIAGLTPSQAAKMPRGIIPITRTDSKKELAGIYTAADVFLNLTYEDNYPTVNLEAQACGTPCITYRTGGCAEMVPPENAVEPGDLESVVRRIVELGRKKS